jgi:hypothetical protein
VGNSRVVFTVEPSSTLTRRRRAFSSGKSPSGLRALLAAKRAIVDGLRLQLAAGEVLVRASVLTVEAIPRKPYSGFARLFADPAC